MQTDPNREQASTLRGRERYDDHIPAAALRAGDELHLTVMGGDDYVTVDAVHVDDADYVTWTGEGWSDVVPAERMVWVRRRENAPTKVEAHTPPPAGGEA